MYKWNDCGSCCYYGTVDCKDCVSGSKFDGEVSAVDMVNRPPHYTHGKYECIDVMVDTFGKEAVQHFCLLNAFKYVWRSEHKNGIEDVKKAWWYLDKYLQLEVEKHD